MLMSKNPLDTFWSIGFTPDDLRYLEWGGADKYPFVSLTDDELALIARRLDKCCHHIMERLWELLGSVAEDHLEDRFR